MDLLQEAQIRLLKKREERQAMEPNTPQIMNFHEEIQAIGDKCLAIARQRAAEIEEARKLLGDPEPKPEKKTEDQKPRVNPYIPKAYRDCTFDSFQGNDKLVQGLKKLDDAGCDIVLHGSTGCGKTHLAIAMMQNKPDAVFTTAPELLLSIRSSFSGNSFENEAYIIDKFASPEILVLDDLGAEKTTEFAITTLYIIIDRRLRDAKRTIITTNLTLKEIEEKLDARIASRLAGMQIVKISMPDYRKRR